MGESIRINTQLGINKTITVNLEQDFNFLREKLGIQEELPHVNKSQHTHYQDYYNTHTQQLVAEYFKRDIELFGYSFDA